MPTIEKKPAKKGQTFTQRQLEALTRWQEVCHEVADGHGYDAAEVESLAYTLHCGDAPMAALEADVDAIHAVEGLHSALKAADETRREIMARYDEANKNIFRIRNELAEAEAAINAAATVGATHGSLNSQLRDTLKTAPRLYARELLMEERTTVEMDNPPPTDEEVVSYVLRRNHTHSVATWIDD